MSDELSFDWTCQTSGQQAPVYVELFRQGGGGGYLMRVQAIEPGEDAPRTVADFERVSVQASESTLKFAAESKQSFAQLAIDGRVGGAAGNRAATLTLVTRGPVQLEQRIEIATTTSLSCSPTR
jgi:hypothetical protein